MRIAIHHRLSLDLGPLTQRAVQQVLLTPRDSAMQTVSSWSVAMAGMERAARFEDAFGNIAHLVNQLRIEGELLVTVEGVVETHDRNGVLGRPSWEPVPALFRRQTALTWPEPGLYEPFLDAARSGKGRIGVLHGLMDTLATPYRERQEAEHTAAGLLIQSQAQAEPETGGRSQSQTHGQMQADGRSPSPEQPQAPPGEPTPEQKAPLPDATELTHRFIGAARALDIPARYVTGYLWTGGEHSAFHAWAEAYDEALGWIGFDAALGLCPTDRHVRIACGLDAGTTTPLRSVPAGGPLTAVGLSVDTAGTQ